MSIIPTRQSNSVGRKFLCDQKIRFIEHACSHPFILFMVVDLVTPTEKAPSGCLSMKGKPNFFSNSSQFSSVITNDCGVRTLFE
ncbi:MAG: hypothetical protein WDO15_22200 [Bacteroidota bacterium]